MTIQPSTYDTFIYNTLVVDDSLLFKGLSCVPLIGIVFQVIKEKSLSQTISSSHGVNLIRLVEVKNHYIIAGIVRELLTLIVIATLMGTIYSSDVYELALWGGSMVKISCVIGFNSFRLHHNRQTLQQWQRNEFVLRQEIW